MKIFKYKLLFFVLFLGFLSCSKDSSSSPIDNSGNGNGNPSGNADLWSIPFEEVRDGGPGKDGIPSVDNPQFTSIENINYLKEDDLIIGYRIGGELRGYPHPILDWHEIVNDSNGTQNTTITYCPLTGTGIAWNREFNGKVTTFGVSGLLYNSNLIPYDRATDSNWSQMLLKGVNGQMINTKVKTSSVFETTWATWKKM
ncbi:MAG TPA: DUF3179 domain-containing protein, partial [Saprospiraceae bacterium]|nr:DUF3179 domain-containing protein [Saprospiraceae bacterium]